MRVYQVDEQAGLIEKVVQSMGIKRTMQDFDGNVRVKIDMRAQIDISERTCAE